MAAEEPASERFSARTAPAKGRGTEELLPIRFFVPTVPATDGKKMCSGCSVKKVFLPGEISRAKIWASRGISALAAQPGGRPRATEQGSGFAAPRIVEIFRDHTAFVWRGS